MPLPFLTRHLRVLGFCGPCFPGDNEDTWKRYRELNRSLILRSLPNSFKLNEDWFCVDTSSYSYIQSSHPVNIWTIKSVFCHTLANIAKKSNSRDILVIILNGQSGNNNGKIILERGCNKIENSPLTPDDVLSTLKKSKAQILLIVHCGDSNLWTQRAVNLGFHPNKTNRFQIITLKVQPPPLRCLVSYLTILHSPKNSLPPQLPTH